MGSHALLWTPNKNLLEEMRYKFEKKDYQVHIKELNTKEDVIPQCRPRAFIVAIKPQGCRRFTWQTSLRYTVPLSKIMFRRDKVILGLSQVRSPQQLTTLKQKGVDPDKTPVSIDNQAGKNMSKPRLANVQPSHLQGPVKEVFPQHAQPRHAHR